MCIICSWKCRTSSISNRRGCLLKKKKLIQEVNEISIFQGAFLCTAGRGAGLRACAANVASSVFAGVFSVGGPPKLKGVGLDVTAAAAAGRGLPGCLRGQGELPGAWFGGAACASWEWWAQLQGGHKAFERYYFPRLSLGFLLSSWCVSLGNAPSDKHAFRLQVALEQLYLRLNKYNPL